MADITLTSTEKVKNPYPPGKINKEVTDSGTSKGMNSCSASHKAGHPHEHSITRATTIRILVSFSGTKLTNIEEFARMHDNAISIKINPNLPGRI